MKILKKKLYLYVSAKILHENKSKKCSLYLSFQTYIYSQKQLRSSFQELFLTLFLKTLQKKTLILDLEFMMKVGKKSYVCNGHD